jgi:hypothetical protein
MYPMVQLRITGDHGALIESLSSQVSDAQFVEQALAKIEEATEEQATLFAYWSDALVAYGRLFMTGRRERLDDSFVRSSEHAETHEIWMELRNRHVAHRVSDAEQVRALALLTALELEPKSVEGVGHFAMKMIGRGDDDLVRDKALASFVRQHLEGELQNATQRALEELQSRPVEELYRRALRGDSYALNSTGPAE